MCFIQKIISLVSQASSLLVGHPSGYIVFLCSYMKQFDKNDYCSLQCVLTTSKAVPV